MRKRTLVRALGVVAALALALVAAGCGGGGSSSGTTTGSSGSATGGTLTMAFGSEPPSLDPGLATDTSSAQVVANTNTPILTLGPAPDLKPLPALAKSWDVAGRERHPSSAQRRQVDERPHRDGGRRRLVVAAHDLAAAGRGLRVPVLRHQGRAGVQQLQAERRESAVQHAEEQGRHLGPGRDDGEDRAHVAAAVVHPAAFAHVVHPGEQGSRRRSGATSGPSRATTSATARSR